MEDSSSDLDDPASDALPTPPTGLHVVLVIIIMDIIDFVSKISYDNHQMYPNVCEMCPN